MNNIINLKFPAACRGNKAMGDCQEGEAQLSPLDKHGVHIPCVVKKINKIIAIYRLSPLQEGFLFHAVYEPDVSQYSVLITWQYVGYIDAIGLKKAWECLVKNHHAFRTKFIWQDIEYPVQVVCENAMLDWQEFDWTDVASELQASQINTLIARERKRHFNLNQLPLMRCILIKLREDLYQFVWVHHHILIDGWCLPLLFEEVHKYYAALKSIGQIDLVATPLYEKYISWLKAQSKQQALSYWHETLQGMTSPTLLPATHIDKLNIYRHIDVLAKHKIVLSEQELAALRKLANRNGVTLNSVLQFTWSLLLSFYSGNEDVVHGAVVSGRSPEIEGIDRMIGLFINTIPIRIAVNGRDRISDRLKRCHTLFQLGNQYSYVSLNDIKEQSSLERDLPLFYSLFIFENYPLTGGKLIHGGNDLEVVEFTAYEQTNYPLTIVAYPYQGLVIEFRYDAEIFVDDELLKVAKRYQHALNLLAQGDGKTVAEIDLLFPEERNKILLEWNNTSTVFRQDTTVIKLFEEQVEKTSGNIAVVCNDHKITYCELNSKANQLANYIRKKCYLMDGSESNNNVLIGVCLERNLYALPGFLGVLKTGFAYIPLDPSYPDERIKSIIEDTGCQLVLTQNNLRERLTTILLSNNLRCDFVFLDDENEAAKIAEEPIGNLSDISISKKNLAYVIFTSGSTGKAKGVQIEHKALVNFLYSMQKIFVLNEYDRFLALTSFAFDISGLEIYLPLIIGACCVLADNEMVKNPSRIKDTITQENISIIQATPVAWQMLFDHGAFTGNFKILCGGEALTTDLARKLKACSKNVWNLYGPTETTIWSTYHQLLNIDSSKNFIPIGKPIDNTQVYVLDANLNLLPPGIIGELYIGGDGLARGYLNQPSLTKTHFVKNPFRDDTWRYIYKTGDLVRWLSDGSLEYMGRNDFQVKVRGFRIELGEIENVLTSYVGIKQAVVVAKENSLTKSISLVGYYVSELKLIEEEVLGYLKERLPEYMVPSILVCLEEMPLTVSGKLDRKSLPEPKFVDSDNYIAPRNELEKQICVIWQKCLHLERVGINDDFFRVGGNSILAIQVSYCLSKLLDKLVKVATLFEHRTVKELAAILCYNAQEVVIPKLAHDKIARLSFSQERLWFIDKYEQGTATYNISLLYELAPEVDVNILEKSIHSIIQRHEILRTVIKEDVDGCGYQEVLDMRQKNFDVVHVKIHDQDELEEELQKDADHIFVLDEDYVIRTVIYYVGDTSKKYLSAVIHHVAFDGWSVEIFLKELETYYFYWLRGGMILQPLAIQYRDFSAWQREYLSGETLAKELNYWCKKIFGYETLNLLYDKTRPSEINYAGKILQFSFGDDLSAKLRHIAKELKVSLYSLLLGAYVLLLHIYSNQNDIVLGIPVANRSYRQLENLIGFFVNTLVLRFKIDDMSVADYIQIVNSEVIKAQTHQELPFEKLVNALNIPKDSSRHPIFQVTFDMQSFGAGLQQSQLFRTYAKECEIYSVSKFDLSMCIDDGAENLFGNINYATSLYEEKTIAEYIETYIAISSQLIDFKKNIFNIKLRREGYVAPRNEQETKLCSIWAEVLGLAANKISIYDDFFRIGGDSILAIRLVSKINKIFCVELKIKDVFVSKCISKIAELVARQQVVEMSNNELSTNYVPFSLIDKALCQKLIADAKSIEDIYPASYLQVGMLLEADLDKNGAYLDVYGYKIKKQFIKNKFSASIAQLVKKHELLRASFVAQNDGYFLVIHKDIEAECKIYVDADTTALIAAENKRNFAYNKAGLFRIIVNDLGADFDFIFSFHHAITDGWSVASFVNELANIYVYDKQLAYTPLRYGEFVKNELAAINNPENLSFWQSYLADLTVPSISWKFDAKKAADNLYNVTFSLESQSVQYLQKIAHDLKISVDTVFLLAYLKTLAFFTNSNEATVGLVVNNRLEKEGGDSVFGLFLNTIPFRCKFTSDKSENHSDLLKIFKQKLKLYKYKLLPYGYIRKFLRQNAYDFVFNFVHFHILDQAKEAIEILDGYGRTNIPFVLNVMQKNATEFAVSMTAHDDYISEDFLNYFAQYYKTCLFDILSNNIDPLRLSIEDYNKIAIAWNGGIREYPKAKTLQELFEAQVIRTPENIAVVYGGKKLTYFELNVKANQLACFIRENYFKINDTEILPDALIGLCVERSVEIIIGILGIIKAGGAFVPIDPDYPDERIKYILNDTKLQLVITQRSIADRLKKLHIFSILYIDNNIDLDHQPKSNLSIINKPNNLAYIIYTSGSTGLPKGVMIEHRSVINLVTYVANYFGIKEKTKVLQFASISFDASIYEIFPTLLAGAELNGLKKDELLTYSSVADMLGNKKIEVAMLPPAVLQTTSCQSLPQLKTIISGGEACTRKMVDEWARDRRFVNAYGPTEITVSCAMGECFVGKAITLGTPLPNVRLYVLGHDMNLLPIGVPGELYVGGDGLARGYLNQSELTQEKFVNNPFATDGDKIKEENLRLYKTGDIVRWLPNGELEFIGRNDFQVKVRGYRIELGEIESVLLQHPHVKECVVVLDGFMSVENIEDKKLIAYYIVKKDVVVSKETLRLYLEQKLPGYMMPTYFIEIDKIPLTISGKVDRKSLPKPQIIQLGYMTPRNELEKTMNKIWASVLQVSPDKIGIKDDFFELGGHSLASIKLANEINANLNCAVVAADIFRNRTIEKLLSFIRQGSSGSGGNEYVL